MKTAIGNRPRRRLAIALLAALLAGLLGGCMGGGKPAPPDLFYQLGEPGPAVRPTGRSRRPLVESIVVRGLRSDGLRQERAMLYTRDPGGLAMERLHYDYWADSPPDLVKIYLVRALRRAEVARLVTGDPVGRRPDLEIGGRLLHFEQLRPENQTVGVRVELELRVEDTRNGGLLLLDHYAEGSEVSEDRMGAVAAAFRGALDRIIARFIADLDRRLSSQTVP